MATETEAYTADQLQAMAELEWRRCSKDFFYWAPRYWWINHPTGPMLFEPRPESQAEVLRVWLNGDNSITLKARQIGWSTLVAAYTFWKAFFHDDWHAMFLSKGEREAIQLLSKSIYGHRRLPQWMKDRNPRLEEAQQRMSFENGSQILSLPSANNPARGYTGNLVVVDEFAFLTNPEEAWASIEPVADIGGQLILLSTANGAGNLFHHMWNKATTTDASSFVPSFYGWWAVPNRDQAWYDEKKAELPPWQLEQEYPSNPEEAFIKSGNMVFPFEIVKGIKVSPGRKFNFTYDRLVADPGGPFTIWTEPDDTLAYSMGVDTAEGLGHGDFSVVSVVSSEGEEVAQYAGHCPPDLLAAYAIALGRKYHEALAMIEVNNHGLVTVTTMRNMGYGNIWRRKQPNTINNTFTSEFGYKTTRNTKPLIIEELHKGLRDGMIIHSERTKQELLNYVRDEHGRTGGSPYDDAVMALALANYGRAFVFEPEYMPEDEGPKYNTIEWWLAQMDQSTDPNRGIGRHNVRPKRLIS